ncbi:MAG: tetratricopeptide repeat protein [Methanoregula sp.]|jgi:tetratricopeptide (TPR) repeat protein|uniref:tetratricopeptide repeat protein n=1 Tax=Methanoregula sp. TaxID=2052170 RepID=UPI003D146AA9
MKILQLLIIGALICFIMPAGAGDTLTATLSVGSGSPGMPPQNASVYISDAKAAVAERNWTDVLLVTTRGIAWYPDNADLLCIQSYSYRKMGQYAKSVDIVSKGILLDPKPVRYANRGYSYLALGNYQAALADAETGIALNASYPATYSVKALALQGMGMNTGALAAIEQALALDPESAHYWHVKGVLLAAGGNCTDAREALEKSLVIDPDYTLPWPGFSGARESLAALDSTCTPATQASSHPPPTKSTASGIAVISVAGALIVLGMRK